MKSRILIYDLDIAQSQAISKELSALAQGDTIAITTARSAASVRLQTARQSPDLLIVALTREGLTLARRLHERAPDLHVVALYDPETTSDMLEAARRLGWVTLDRMADTRQLARRAAALIGLCATEPDPGGPAAPARPSATLGDVQLLLDVLRREARAQLVLYTDQIGNLIAQRGDAGSLDLVALTSLIAGGFNNSLELGRALHDPDTRHLNVLEGQNYDVYATNAGSDHLLALVYDKKFVEPKLGYVWLLLKRGATQLSQMRIVEGTLGEVLCEELSASLNSEFDRLFGGDLELAP